MSSSVAPCAEPCERPCTITLHAPSGAILYQGKPSLREESTVDWVKIMANLIREHHPHTPTQVYLVADDDQRTFAMGNSLAAMYWVDKAWWGELMTTRRKPGQIPHPEQPTDSITSMVISTALLSTGDRLRHCESGYWTITGIRDGARGYDFTMMHNLLQWERSFASQQIWYWHTMDTVPLNIKMCQSLAKHMPHARMMECAGCARLLMALGGPARHPARHGIRFPARGAECTCERQPHSILFVTSRDHSYAYTANHFDADAHSPDSPDCYLEFPDSPRPDLP